MSLMKRHTMLLVALLAILNGCISNEEEILNKDASRKVYVTVDTRGILKESSEENTPPVISSIRLLVFSSSTGECVGNEKFQQIETQSDGSCKVGPMALSAYVDDQSIDVYAILNEDGFCSTIAETGKALGYELSRLSIGSLKTTLTTLLQKPLRFTNSSFDTNTEPAFVMCASRENIAVTTSSGSPFTINLTPGEEDAIPRSMAKITINEIIGEAQKDVSSIFVSDIRLIRVSQTYSLNGNQAETSNKPTEITIGEKNLSGYYDRNWDGTVTVQYNGEIELRSTLDERYYKVRDGKHEDSYAFNGTPFNYEHKNLGDRAKEAKKENYDALRTALISKYPSDFSDGILDDAEAKTVNISTTEWRIPTLKSVYVPENKEADKNLATAIAITLTIATPELVSADELYNYLSSYPIFSITDGVMIGDLTNNRDKEDFFKNNANYCWADNPDRINVNGGNDHLYNYFIGPFYATRKGYIHQTFTRSENAVPWTGFNIRKQQFIIPVNNKNVDSDYSIKRNKHYKITLKVDNETYRLIPSTKSGTHHNDCPIKTTVEVSPIE